MKKFFSLLLLEALFISQISAMNVGDIVFVSYKREASTPNTGFFTLLARENIPSGTIIVLSNYYYSLNSSGAQTFSNSKSSYPNASGELEIELLEGLAMGQTFQVSFDNTGNNNVSSVGNLTMRGLIDFYPEPESSVIWLYEHDDNTGVNTTITGIMWSDKLTGNVQHKDLHELPPGIKWTSLPNHTSSTYNSWHGTNATALNLLNGTSNANKCGAWNPYQSPSSTSYKGNIDFTENLENTFYNQAEWVFNSSNTLDACDKAGVQTQLCDEFLATYITFDTFRYGYLANTWQVFDGNNWVTATPNWANGTLSDKEVWIYQNLELGVFDKSAPSATLKVFKCAKLVLRDEINDGVTLTIAPGNSLQVFHSITMSELTANSVMPKIHLESDISTETTPRVYNATIIPTTAKLLGTYKVDKYINDPDWHHFKSPIKVKLKDVEFNKTSGSPFQFDYTGNGSRGYKNVYWWDADNLSEVFWQPVSSTTGEDYFSDRAYTIYFESGDVPTLMSVTGTVKHSDPDSVKVSPAEFINTTATSPGQNAPGWSTPDKAGWNFYGNPFLGYIKYGDLILNFGGNLNLMSGLSNSVYVWDPNRGGINSSSNYVINDGIVTNEASYIEPFQAFFMKTVSAASANGFVTSKRYVSEINATPTVSNKNYSEFSLELRPGGSPNPQRIYFIPSQSSKSIEKDVFKDGVFSGASDDFFCLFSDSSWYSIKHVPEEFDTLTLQVGAANPSNNLLMEIRKSQYYPSDYNVYLNDKKFNILHDLSTPYVFLNDNNFIGNRFEWITVKTGHVSIQENSISEYCKVYMDGDQVCITVNSGEIHNQLTCSTIDGREILNRMFSKELQLSSSIFTPGQVYVFIVDNHVLKYLHSR